MEPVGPTYSYEDYAALPNDGRRWEVIDGELELIPTPDPRHQTVSRRLQFELMRLLEEPGIAQIFDAPIDLILSDSNILQPDLAILASSRDHLISARGIDGPPDIVVEILSPSTKVLDQRVKKRTYARFSVPEYWIVDPIGGHVKLFRLAADDYVLEQRFDRASVLTTPSFSEVQNSAC